MGPDIFIGCWVGFLCLYGSDHCFCTETNSFIRLGILVVAEITAVSGLAPESD